MTPEKALAAISALEKFGINLGLDRVRACLDALGNPHLAYPSIHVGGTNGKGSTSLLIASALSRSGYRTGLYTSPPLEFFGERIRVDGLLLPDEAVPPLLEAVLAAAGRRVEARDMTQFEVITAMAFLHFSRVGTDAAVVEVGLGGRLDSTNVIVPEVSVITNVGLEHAEHLGPNVEAIAAEKAGIVKAGVPVVTAAEGGALGVIEAAAAKAGSPVIRWGHDFQVERERRGRYRFSGKEWRLAGLELGLGGGYQRFNLGVALATLEVLAERGWRLEEEGIRCALREARWAGRLEALGPGPRVLLDGAHNAHASPLLARTLREEFRYRRLWLVLGVLGDKDARAILGDLVPLADRVVLTRSSSTRARDPQEMEHLARAVRDVPCHTAPNVADALDWALERADADDLVCVTGSLTTVGEARASLRVRGWLQ